MTEIVFEITGMSKEFGPVAALRDMNLVLGRGRVHTLLGENGAGKSTLMKIISGLFRPTSGEMRLRGKPYAPRSPRHAKDLGITIIHQELSLCGNLSVADNVMAAHEPHRFGFLKKKALRRSVTDLVNRLQIPIDPRARVGELSVARQQLVEIAKGLSHEADIVIFDEPTSSLSDAEADILFGIISDLKRRGCAILYISHRMEEIMRISDDITVIRDGCHVWTGARETTSISELIRKMVGRSIEEIYPPRTAPVADAGPVMSVKQLCSPGHFEPLSFDIRPGEILGFFGLVGSGRTEVMKALFGMLPCEGTVEIDGQRTLIDRPSTAISKQIAFVTENRKEEGLILSQSIRSNVNMVALGDFVGPFGMMRSARERSAAQASVKQISVKAQSIATKAGNLSGGNQQKVVIAKWLQRKPRIFILDEPTRGIDVGAKREVYKIIRDLSAAGTAVIFVSSELPEILGLSDRVAVMHAKKLVGILDATDLQADTVLTYASGLN